VVLNALVLNALPSEIDADNLLRLMKTDALVQKFRDLNVWRRGDERAPHKPPWTVSMNARSASLTIGNL
jgi:hypothetical protein